ncbi:hypothetical protein E3N88_01352 [Mikania micrantha]|uniref:Uncharacterized protein n=1 Tax=Mikania micrantha TaxID=192012 RepID=A0A5N6Q2C6_9ASTR|nr:hypothetical protein E3N88_01352 [Mikania micrantha]
MKNTADHEALIKPFAMKNTVECKFLALNVTTTSSSSSSSSIHLLRSIEGSIDLLPDYLVTSFEQLRYLPQMPFTDSLRIILGSMFPHALSQSPARFNPISSSPTIHLLLRIAPLRLVTPLCIIFPFWLLRYGALCMPVLEFLMVFLNTHHGFWECEESWIWIAIAEPDFEQASWKWIAMD